MNYRLWKDGTPKDFTITAGLNKECDEAAINALRHMPKWKPAIFYGRPVDVPQSLAIEFSILRE